MSVVFAVFAIAISKQVAAPVDLRKYEIKPAGIEIQLPKSWSRNRNVPSVTHSLRVPIDPKAKKFARFDLGYSLNDSLDVDLFQSSKKDISILQGYEVLGQWNIDVNGNPLAITKLKRQADVTLSGVLFKPGQAKMTLSVSGTEADVATIESQLPQLLSTIRDIPVVMPASNVATPVRYTVDPEDIIVNYKASKKVEFMIANAPQVLHLPTKSKVLSSDANSATYQSPEFKTSFTVTVFSTDDESDRELFARISEDSKKYFSGAIDRVDESRNEAYHEVVRRMIFRSGNAAEGTGKVRIVDVVVATPYGSVFRLVGSLDPNENLQAQRTKFRRYVSQIKLIKKTK